MENKAWLEECYTGVLKKLACWENFGKEIQAECGKLIKIRYMGDDMVLLENMSRKSFDELEKDLDEWFSNWFEWVRPWKEHDVSLKRLVWMKWFGVPLHAWSRRFFATISLKFGTLVKLDKSTENNLKLDEARVLVNPHRESYYPILEC